MKTFLPVSFAVAALSAACGPAFASARLAEEKQCMQCHAIDRHTIGPSFQEIGAIYRRMKSPVPKLVAVMRDGSDAHLGSMRGKARMPDDSERPRISDREAKQLARWILARRSR